MRYEEIVAALRAGEPVTVPWFVGRDGERYYQASGYACLDTDRRPTSISDVNYDAECADAPDLAERTAAEWWPVQAWSGEPQETRHVRLEVVSVGVRIDEAGHEAVDFPLVQTVMVALEPNSPDCIERDHEWIPANELDPTVEYSVSPNGGGPVLIHWCAHCGARRETDTWSRNGPIEGLYSTRYCAANKQSLRASMRNRARRTARSIEYAQAKFGDGFLDALMGELQEAVDLVGYAESYLRGKDAQDVFAQFVRVLDRASGGGA